MIEFTAKLEKIGINPFVFLPEPVLSDLFIRAGKSKGNIPVCGKINDLEFSQTLLKYKGEWRLYVNTEMLPNSPKRIGETITVTIEFDTKDRNIPIHPKLAEALQNDLDAKNEFDKLIPSFQKEIIRYISFLKSDKSVDKNINLALGFLKGKNKFLTRQPIKTEKYEFTNKHLKER